MHMLNSLTTSVGAYVAIHTPGKTPSLQNDAILVQPGTETNVAVSGELKKFHSKQEKTFFEFV